MSQHIHFLGICGYAVSGAALVAKEMGYLVTGSDDQAYPPTTDVLTDAGIPWVDGSDPANLERWGVPDRVVVGNQTRPDNPEWLAAKERGLPTLSEIEFYVGIAQDRLRIAVCGTHGKTTTTGLVAHILNVAGLDPGLRLGSVSLDLGTSARLGSGPFVFEGDEYSTAPWDSRPKFLHMDPKIACVTRLELDHPDIYPDLDAYRAPFTKLARTMPAGGLLVLCADDAETLALRDDAASRVVTYGTDGQSDCVVTLGSDDGQKQHFTLSGALNADVTLTFPGVHNALNATAAILMALDAGAGLDDCLAACATCRGPGRRFQILRSADTLVVDDYAHHPTECAAALAAARRRWPMARIIAVHTPHTYSRTATLLNDYADVFADSDRLILGPIEAARERGKEAIVSSDDVLKVVSAPGKKEVVSNADAAIAAITADARPDDVVVVLSLGGFDKIALRLAAALEAAHA